MNAETTVAETADDERKRLLLRIDELSNQMFQACAILQTLIDECDIVVRELSPLLSRYDFPLLPLRDRLRSAVKAAKEAR